MKIKRVVIGIAIMAMGCPGLLSAQEITLQDMVEKAQKNSTLPEQESVLRSMGHSISNALWNAYLPTFSIEGRWHYQSEVTELTLDAPDRPIIPGGDKLGLPTMKELISDIQIPEIPRYQYMAYLQATQLIWDGGRVSAGRLQAASKTNAQIAETKVERRKVERAVIELYFSLLMLDKQAEMQGYFLSELSRQKNKVVKALDNGLASRNSLDEIMVEELKAKQKKAEIQQSLRAILDALEVYTDQKLADETKAAVPEAPALRIVPISEVRTAPTRPEHLVLDARLQIADAEWKSFKSKLMPTLALFAQGGYGRPGLNLMDPNPRTYIIYGIKLNWNFGQLYNLSAERKKHDYSQQLIALKRSAFERQVRASSAQHHNEIEQYRNLLQQDDQILRLRKEISDRAEVQVEEGTMSVYDRVQRMTAYQMAEQTKALHELQMLRAMYRQKMTIE